MRAAFVRTALACICSTAFAAQQCIETPTAIVGEIATMSDGSDDSNNSSALIVAVAGGRLLSIHRHSRTFGPELGSLVLQESIDDGRSWSSARQIYRDVKYDVVNPTGGLSSRGRLFVFFELFEPSHRSNPLTLAYMTSDDNGATWSAPVTLNNMKSVSGPLVETPDALLMTGIANGDHVVVLSGDPNGSSWQKLAQIPIPNKVDQTHLAMIALPNNVLLGFAVTNYNRPLLRLYSADGGKTWDVAETNFLPSSTSGYWWILDYPWIGRSGGGSQLTLTFFEGQLNTPSDRNVGNVRAITFDPRWAITQPQAFGPTSTLYSSEYPLMFGQPTFAVTGAGEMVTQFTAQVNAGAMGSIWTVRGHYVGGCY